MKQLLLVSLALIIAVPCADSSDFSIVGPRLEPVIHEEMREWQIGGIAVALVDDQRVVYAAGFGEAKRDSIFRVGSISKLFNAVAVMQQVEAGKLDLDAPLPPDVLPLNPFSPTNHVTLRQILCHRSGLQREPTVGGYFDDAEPGLAATVASVAPCVLVTRPGEKMRYSNLGPSIAGHLVERASGQTFAEYQRARLLAPLGMTNSAWTLAQTQRKRLIVSHMRVADGRGGWKREKAPVFDLGTIPAGNLFSTADDLARFLSALLAGGAPLITPQTLAEMWRPQLTTETNGFGLGFVVGKFREHRTVGHSGAVYGHSTTMIVLPEKKLGVIVLANEDIANGRVRRIANTALSLLLEARFNEQPPAVAAAVEVKDVKQFAGDYESQSYWARLEVREGKLVGDLSGQLTKFTPAGELKFTANSRIDDATPVTFTRNESGAVTGFTMGSQRYARVPANAPALPKHWRAYLGRYGPEYMPLLVTERHGHLYVMTENMVDYRLTPMNRNVCSLPPGMYVDEEVVFLTGTAGRVHSINFANMIFPRRR